MEKITYYNFIDGISLEHMVRYGKFDMRVKHFHNEYEIFYIIEGERLFFFNNRTFLASKGDLILVDSNLIHMTKSSSDDDNGHNRIIFYVSKEKMQEFDEKYPTLQLVRFFHNHYGVYRLSKQQQEDFMDLYYFFKEECKHRKHNYKQAIELKMTFYLLNLTRQIDHQPQELPMSSSNDKYKNIYVIADYLSHHIEDNISLEQLSSQFYLSKYYICHAFKEVTGYTINEYVNIHRIQQAKRYLEETDDTISDIANRLGYRSITYFERVFKSYMSVSPLRYRKTLNIVTFQHHLPDNP